MYEHIGKAHHAQSQKRGTRASARLLSLSIQQMQQRMTSMSRLSAQLLENAHFSKAWFVKILSPFPV
jgi:hypothetical protein